MTTSIITCGTANLALAAHVTGNYSSASQLSRCSIVLAADSYVGIALELALSAADAAVRLILRAGR